MRGWLLFDVVEAVAGRRREGGFHLMLLKQLRVDDERWFSLDVVEAVVGRRREGGNGNE